MQGQQDIRSFFLKELNKEVDSIEIDGLILIENFITPTEEQQLLSCIDSEIWDTRLCRRTQHYGYIYDYTSGKANTKAAPIPEWCNFIIDRLCSQNVLSERPNQIIINEYLPGQGIGPHIDDPNSFKDGIVSLTLGSACMMDFSCTEDTKSVYLQRRSIVSLHRDARYKWKHGITPRKSDNGIKRLRRVSITFRTKK